LGLVKYNNDFSKHQQLSFNRISAIVNADSGYYIASNAGIYFLKEKGNHMELIRTIPDFKGNAINLVTHNKHLWIGSRNNGVFVFNGIKMVAHLNISN
jgi:ligand-binding sensor domain-containing protein